MSSDEEDGFKENVLVEGRKMIAADRPIVEP